MMGNNGEYAFYQVDGKLNPAEGGTKYVGILEFMRARTYMGVIVVSKAALVAKKRHGEGFSFPNDAYG